MNLPNWLSIFRIALVPVFVIVYFGSFDYANIYAVVVYGIASLTDILDGNIARKYNKTTKLGRILDPLGDKIMTFSVLLCITIDKIIPVWAVIIVFVKEMMMAIGGFILMKKSADMPPSNSFGKCATVVFFLTCAYLTLFKNTPKPVATVLISIAITVLLAALASYLVRYIRMMRAFRDAGVK